MFKVVSLFMAIAFLSACAGTGPSVRDDSLRDAEAAARAALAAMDGGGPIAPGMAAAGQRPGARPVWVDNPDAVYPRARFVTAVGHGTTRVLAERDALARIVGFFGQAVQSELRTVVTFSEAVRDGVIHVTEDTDIHNAITTSAQMDTLLGAEIGGVWHDTANALYYAVAVMEKERTATLYSNLIRSNELIIEGLVNMTNQERNSLDGFARYRLAAVIADTNRVYANVLTIVGDTRGINPAVMRQGDDFRIAASNVLREIPIGVAVSGDRYGRIQHAFAGAVTAAGLRSGPDASRYVIRVSYNVSPLNFPGQPNQFVLFELLAAFEDSAGGSSVLFVHPAMVGREGHLSVPQAEELALRTVERRIQNEFTPAFRAFFAEMVTIRRN